MNSNFYIPRLRQVLVHKIAMVLAVSLVVGSRASLAWSASFNCKGATTAVEKMICSNANLSSLDEDMARVYLQALVLAPDSKTLKKEQRDWINRKRNLCINVDCLSSNYTSRIFILRNISPAKENTSSTVEISGTWEELKPAAGGPFWLIIDKKKIRFSYCDRTFHLRQTINGEYIFVATKVGKCDQFSERFKLNLVKISITDEETIHAEFYADTLGKEFVGSDNFFRIE